PLVVGDEADAAAAALPNRVDLVDEHDRRGGGSCVREQIAHTCRADADKHLHELRTAGLEESDASLSCGRLRNQRLARPWRTDEQNALRDSSTEAGESLRRLQEHDDLLQLGDRFIRAADIRE